MAEFTLFPLLPLEIRRMIWKLCLPRRVIDIAGVVRGDGGYYGRCEPRRAKGERNGSPPRILSVCREAAQVAREMGYMEKFGWYEKTRTWVQPTLDRAFNINHYHDLLREIPLEYLISYQIFTEAERVPVEISIVSDYLYQFDLPPIQLDRLDARFSIGVGARDDEQMSIYASILNTWEDWVGKLLYVQLCIICIHVPPAAARASGLFGLLGDEMVQTVDVDDTDRLRAFATLVKNEDKSTDTRPDVVGACEKLLDPSFLPRVQEWKAGIDWTILTYTWELDRQNTANGSRPGDLQDLYQAWEPLYSPPQPYIRANEQSLVESHPWVKKARADMWKIRPQIMFRLCYEDCHLLPPSFDGSY
ncbi:hypothetical protein VHEMI08946 [[Torrubiella] hemipterigena]|uniref:2EXR domain-containing protein n=1 Tax=[Torrubiella] hemipterigena TaxID=1531966 RepID=A0A0A1TPF5_9HYPO|nr:hypothetical protein VHEMI08946 [[Torrubiella] hemipterigena]